MPQLDERVEPAESSDVGGLDPFVRLRLEIAYDGTDFSGWAVQPGRRTVQDVLQQALGALLRSPAALTVAGRTDSGVHASGQVAHLDVPRAWWHEQRPLLVRRLAGLLPPDVRVRAVSEVPAEFDARFAALWRRYEYRICDRPEGPDPLTRHSVLRWPRRLDAAAMNDAAARLVGLHDFAAFCKRPDRGTTIRTLQACAIARTTELIVCAVQADAFCHSMVRSLVGALIAVGEGRKPSAWPAEQLTGGGRAAAAVAPAHGLCLVEVRYPSDAQLAQRAATTRATRGQ